MSGTSNTMSDIVSRRPCAVSATAWPIVTVAVRPVTTALRSPSRIAGISSTGRIIAPVATMLTASPSSGIGGPRRDRFLNGELTAISMRWMAPRAIRSITHSRSSGTIRIGHMRFKAPTDIGVPVKPSVSRGSPA